LLTRMSGSGATCFALCAEPSAAKSLAGRLATARPDWWVRAGTLGGA
jgi:4-diphosphocytidyl-2-C-methyl-D-erythritol kinase